MPTKTYDALDHRILESLQRDCTLTNAALADLVGLSPSPCLRRVRILETDGIIKGYAAKISRKGVGLDLAVITTLKLVKHRVPEAEQVKRIIRNMTEVIACYVVSGEADMLLHILVKDLSEYRLTLERLAKIPEIHEIRSSFVMDVFKEDTPLPLGNLG